MPNTDATWVTLNEASARAGVSISWLRKQYRRNGLPTIEVAGSRGLQKAVPLEEVLARAATFTTAAAAPSATLRPPEAAANPGKVAPDQDLPWLDRLIDAEARAARAEADAAYLRLRLEDAFAEVDRLRYQLTVLLEPPRTTT